MSATVTIYAKVSSTTSGFTDDFPGDNYAQVKVELQSEPVNDADRPTVDDYNIQPQPGASMPSADVNGTASPTITVRIDATDPDGFPIYQQLVGIKRYSSTSRKWELVGSPKWYNTTDNLIDVYLGIPNTTTLKAGAYYIIPFVSDVQGISQGLTDTTKLKYVNLYANETIKAGTVRIFRVWAGMGQTINFSVTTSAGDVDAYLYQDADTTTPPQQVFSDTATANGAMISVMAPVTGTYQIEVINSKDDAGTAPAAVITGYGQATVSATAPKAQGKTISAPTAKVFRTAPVAPPSESPSVRVSTPQSAAAVILKMYLPILRGK